MFSKSAKVIVCDPDDKQRGEESFLYRVQWGSAKAEMYNHPISNEFIQPSLDYHIARQLDMLNSIIISNLYPLL